MAKGSNISLPLIPLRGITVFPNMVISFAVGREKSMIALESAMSNDETVFLVTQKDPRTVNPTNDDLYDMGTIAKVKQILKLPGNMTHIIVEGIIRGRIMEIKETEKYTIAEVTEYAQDKEEEIDDGLEALMRIASESFEEYTKVNSKTSTGESVVNIISAAKPGQMADVIAGGLAIKVGKKQEILEIIDPILRLKETLKVLNYELEITNLKRDLEEKVKVKLDATQKEYFLREQMKVIQEELGDKDGIFADVERLKKKLLEKKLPSDIDEIILKEINRMSRIPISSPESNVIRNYVEYVLDLPWNERSKESFEIKKAEKILNSDHYGLEKVKERIIEFLAVRQNAPLSNSPIICLVGPPGVGKTSIAKSIAKSLNRTYIRMSLGGVKDESEIRGHRKTYVGAMPGRIMNAMKLAKTNNPLMLLDEVDKLSTSYNGDPASALLEVLDAEQNNTFRDHYIEVPYDLSHVLFICTANSLDTIPSALKDRMEIISLSSYTVQEKKNIAIKHLYQKQLKKHGLKKGQLKISESGFESIIDYYTREAGVRQLERVIGEVCRKTVKIILSGDNKNIAINSKNIEDYLGAKKYKYDKIYENAQIGIVRGLAWTQVGGDTLSIEVNKMKGTGKFELTGNMGDVMKESAKAAISYIRSKADQFQIPEEFYKDTDIHIHIPEGAVPKDGPSAGITMATGMISALTQRYVRNDIAMTGEITIRGRVLPIGGLKEKVIAAKRAGIVKIIIPFENKRDLCDITDEVKNGIEFVFAKGMDEVIENAFLEGGKDGSK